MKKLTGLLSMVLLTGAIMSMGCDDSAQSGGGGNGGTGPFPNPNPNPGDVVASGNLVDGRGDPLGDLAVWIDCPDSADCNGTTEDTNCDAPSGLNAEDIFSVDCTSDEGAFALRCPTSGDEFLNIELTDGTVLDVVVDCGNNGDVTVEGT